MNKASSRSHCIFTMRVESKEQTEDGLVMTRTGKLHMVDLAGSECAKSAGSEDAKQERERKNINTSLLALGKVINALKTGGSKYIRNPPLLVFSASNPPSLVMS
jgi:kinesin family protein 11